MSGLIDKRKRSREDEICESSDFPLSKRINNLHLNNNFEESSSSSCLAAAHNELLLQQQQNLLTSKEHMLPKEQLNGYSVTTPVELGAVVNAEQMHLYNPELNESENPFYYDKNKMLHALHLERLKRGTV